MPSYQTFLNISENVYTNSQDPDAGLVGLQILPTNIVRLPIPGVNLDKLYKTSSGFQAAAYEDTNTHEVIRTLLNFTVLTSRI